VKFTDGEYEFLTGRPDLHCFCFECDAKVVKGIEQDREIEQRCEVFFGKLNVRMEIFEANVDKKVAAMDSRKEMELARTKDEISKELQILSSEINSVKGIVDTQLGNNNKDIKALSVQVNEMLEGQDKSWSDAVKK